MVNLIVGLIAAAATIITTAVTNNKTEKANDAAREEAMNIANQNRTMQLRQNYANNQLAKRSLSLREDELSFSEKMMKELQKDSTKGALNTLRNTQTQIGNQFASDFTTGVKQNILDKDNTASRLF